GTGRAWRGHDADRACRGRETPVPQRGLFRAARRVALCAAALADAGGADRDACRSRGGTVSIRAGRGAPAVRAPHPPERDLQGRDAMISTLLWTLIAVQIALGAFDTLYHHELTERLAWRGSQRRELKLHGVRNLL